MTTTISPAATWKSRFGVVAVMMGIFSIVTTEILPIGLLPPIADEFGISAGTAGLTMTIPGFVAAVAAPAVTVASGRIDRRTMLCVLMAVLAVADFLAASAQAYWMMLVSRVLVGLTIGGFWSIGAGLAGRLVPERSVARATAVIFAAVPLGSVLGVPAGTFVGHLAGWRTSFLAMGLLTLGVLAALVLVLPPLPVTQVTRLNVLWQVIRAPQARVGLAATVLIVTAHFSTYTYVTPFLEQVGGVDAGLVGAFLLAYGVAGIAGNFVAGAAIPRSLRSTFAGSACALAAATLLLPVAGAWSLGLLVVWGLAYGAVPVCSQTWFTRSAPQAQEAAMVVFTSSFQATLSFGALLGGVVVDATSTSTVMVLGGLLAVLAAATLAWKR
ncbi:MFS transporter [Actinomadura sp. 6N118]|uniref:MFS transporter n=1 Tax=Actinomadura sp. 6N118 TaxID=3375151 RepID=UPI0037B66785